MNVATAGSVPVGDRGDQSKLSVEARWHSTAIHRDHLACFSAQSNIVLSRLFRCIICASLYERSAYATGVSPGPSVGPHM